MRDENYIRMRHWFHERQPLDRTLHYVSEILTGSIYVIYIGTVCVLAFRKSPKLKEFLAVPAGVFAAGSALRTGLDADRPYDRLDLELYDDGSRKFRRKYKRTDEQGRKQRFGKSTPSRHCFSAAVIAVAMGRLDTRLEAAMWGLASAVCISRVLSGAHWIHDVLAGLAFGGISGKAAYALVDAMAKKKEK